jgi:hypothetical protein
MGQVAGAVFSCSLWNLSSSVFIKIQGNRESGFSSQSNQELEFSLHSPRGGPALSSGNAVPG